VDTTESAVRSVPKWAAPVIVNGHCLHPKLPVQGFGLTSCPWLSQILIGRPALHLFRGLVRENGFCSPPCPADFDGHRDAFTCYQTCPSNRPANCNAFGCAKDGETCISVTNDQLLAAGTLVFNIVTAGIAAGGGTAANVTTKGAKLKVAAERLQSLIENAQKVYTAVTTIKARSSCTRHWSRQTLT
jgi:hypothetical protein